MFRKVAQFFSMFSWITKLHSNFHSPIFQVLSRSPNDDAFECFSLTSKLCIFENKYNHNLQCLQSFDFLFFSIMFELHFICICIVSNQATFISRCFIWTNIYFELLCFGQKCIFETKEKYYHSQHSNTKVIVCHFPREKNSNLKLKIMKKKLPKTDNFRLFFKCLTSVYLTFFPGSFFCVNLTCALNLLIFSKLR